jgi:hypothetical protein
MRLALALGMAVAALAPAGCGDDKPALSVLCTEGQPPIERALRRAPAPVTLADGTPLSQCVANARDIGELQSFGFIITRLADRLADRAPTDGAAAIRLGYLIGAARRGAEHGQGVPDELVHRLEVTARRLPERAQRTLERGLAAGERSG